MQLIFSFFWKHVKPYKWWYAVMMTAPIVTAFYPFVYNYAIKLFLDVMTQDRDFSVVSTLYPITLFLSAHLSLDLIWRVSSWAELSAEPFVRRSIVLATYDKVQHYPYSFFQNNFTGAITTKLKGILDGYDKFFTEIHHGLMVKFLKCAVNFVVLYNVNQNLGIFVMGWVVIYVPVMYKMSCKLNYYSFEETECRHHLMGTISDKMSNIFTLFSFTGRRFEYAHLNKIMTHDFIPKQQQVYRYDIYMQIVGFIFYFILFSFLIFYMIYLRKTGVITVGDFAFVFGIAHVVGDDIWSATVSTQDFARAMGDLKSALTIMHIEPETTLLPKKQLLIESPTLEFRDVSFTYDDKQHVLHNINLTIQAGEKVGLVGHSGAGKTSLVNLLMRYFYPTAGSILIDGQPIAEVDEDSLRQQIAIIPQETLLFHRSLKENISYGKPEASDDAIIEASKKAHLHEFIMQLPEEYDTAVGERGLKLSGGQRQRIAIARAILKDAPFLILDEATSALDSQTEKLIQDSLSLLMEDQQKTVIAIAHRLSTLKHMDRIIVLDKGIIVEEGTHQQLIRRPKSLYKKLWELQDMEKIIP